MLVGGYLWTEKPNRKKIIVGTILQYRLCVSDFISGSMKAWNWPIKTLIRSQSIFRKSTTHGKRVKIWNICIVAVCTSVNVCVCVSFRRKLWKRVWPSAAWASWCHNSLRPCCCWCRRTRARMDVTASNVASEKAADWWWTRWTTRTFV